MKIQHTPGPWKVDHNCTSVIIGADDTEIGTVESDADACLIAAAPDLLTACQDAKKYLEPDLVEPGRTVFWNLVAAIAKAEGSQP